MLPVGNTTLLAGYGKVYHTWPSTSTTVREVLHTGHGVSTVVLEYLPFLFPLIKITNRVFRYAVAVDWLSINRGLANYRV